MLSRPGIYVVSLVLAAVMVFAAFTFNPTNRGSAYSNINQETVTEIYNTFTMDELYKTYCDNIVSATDDYISSCTGSNETKSNIDNLYNNFMSALANYKNTVQTDASLELKNQRKNELKLAITNLETALFTNGIDMTTSGQYKILINVDDYNYLKQQFSLINYNLDSSSSLNSQHLSNLSAAESFQEKLIATLNKLVYPVVSDDLTLTLDQISTTNATRRSTYLSNMTALKSSISTEDDEKKLANRELMNEYIQSYYNTSLLYSNIVSSSIQLNVFKNYSNNEINKFKYFEDYNKYSAEESLTKQTYLWDSETFEDDYANPIAFQTNSNIGSASAYDFMFYALEIFSFVIIVYALFLASNSIAGEKSDGTIKLIAIKPVNRSKIFNGKLLFCLLISLILLIFSAIISFVVGAFMYGLTSASVLVVFNANTAFVLHPALYMLIYVVSIFIKVFVFISIGMLLTTLFKSGTIASMIGLLVYFIDLVVGVILYGNKLLKLLPLHNISLVSFFGNISYTNGSGIVSKLFANNFTNPPILWLSLLYIIGISIFTILFGIMNFKRKDLA